MGLNLRPVTAITSSTGSSLANYSINPAYLAANSPLTAGLTNLLSPNAVILTRAPIYAIVTPVSGVVSGVTNLANTTTLVGVIPGTSVSASTILTIPTGAGKQIVTNNGTTLSGPNAEDYAVISSNLAGNATNNVTPDIVSTGNGGGTIIIAAPASETNSGTIINKVTTDNTVKTPVVTPTVTTEVKVETSSNNSVSLTDLGFVSKGAPEVGNVVFKVTQSNGEPLPSWVTVDPVTHVMTVEDVPEAKNSNLTLNIQQLVNGKVKKEAIITLQK
jgi:hypothetical protein